MVSLPSPLFYHIHPQAERLFFVYSPMWVDGKKRGFNVYAKTREEVEVKLAELIMDVKAKKKRLLAEMTAEIEEGKKRKKK